MDTALWLAVAGVVSAWVVTFFSIRRWGPGHVRRQVNCPCKGLRANVVVEQREGEFGSLRVADVVACSLLPEAPLSCGKECLARL